MKIVKENFKEGDRVYLPKAIPEHELGRYTYGTIIHVLEDGIRFEVKMELKKKYSYDPYTECFTLSADQITKRARFNDIPQFTKSAPYAVDVDWNFLEDHLDHMNDTGRTLDLDPDFQRGHVWSEKKQIEYVEFILRGGDSSKDLFFNQAKFQDGEVGVMVLVDGKQRLQAVRLFMANKIKAFGLYRNEYGDKPDMMSAKFRIHVNDLETRAEVLQWYLDLNTGGVVHTSEEINKVKALLKKEKKSCE